MTMKSTARQWLLEGIPAWTRSALYLQFAASTFSIAGTGLAHAMMLLGFAGYLLANTGLLVEPAAPWYKKFSP